METALQDLSNSCERLGILTEKSRLMSELSSWLSKNVDKMSLEEVGRYREIVEIIFN